MSFPHRTPPNVTTSHKLNQCHLQGATAQTLPKVVYTTKSVTHRQCDARLSYIRSREFLRNLYNCRYAVTCFSSRYAERSVLQLELKTCAFVDKKSTCFNSTNFVLQLHKSTQNRKFRLKLHTENPSFVALEHHCPSVQYLLDDTGTCVSSLHTMYIISSMVQLVLVHSLLSISMQISATNL